MTPRAKSRLDETYFRGCLWVIALMVGAAILVTAAALLVGTFYDRVTDIISQATELQNPPTYQSSTFCMEIAKHPPNRKD